MHGSFFLFLCSCFCFSKGYHSVTVTYSKPLHIKLSNNMLVFVLREAPPAGVTFSVIDAKNKTHPVSVGTYTHIQFLHTTVFVSAALGTKVKLNFWLVPPDLCNTMSYSAVADSTLAFDISGQKVDSEVCIFSQTGAFSYSSLVKFTNGNPGASVDFYTNPKHPQRRCMAQDAMCHFKSTKPFFARVTGTGPAALQASFVFGASKKSTGIIDCEVAPLPTVIEPRIQVSIGEFIIANIACVSAVETALNYLAVFVISVIGGIVFLVILHAMGVINLFSVLRCGRDGSRFLKLRENPFVKPIKSPVNEEEA